MPRTNGFITPSRQPFMPALIIISRRLTYWEDLLEGAQESESLFSKQFIFSSIRRPVRVTQRSFPQFKINLSNRSKSNIHRINCWGYIECQIDHPAGISQC